MKYLFLILFTTSTIGYGQLNSEALGSISGKVMDKNLQQPIPYASISLKTATGEVVTGTISNDQGEFEIEKIPYNIYTLVIQYMGYASFSKEVVVSAEEKAIVMESIYLITNVSELEGVVVQAERTTIEQLIDRKVVHVGKDLSSSGSSAAEIMNKIPSVRVDMDGNISLRGDGNVRVLVDGKPTNIDAATLLKQIPASSIEKIELITNPSAKYSPEGMSGMINIVLKKNSNLGFNGTLTGGVTMAEHIKSDASLNMNYRSGKFNFYTNLGVNAGESEKLGFINEVGGPAEDLHILSEEQGQLVKIGVDYYLNDRNVISLYTNQNFINEDLTLLTRVTYPETSEQNYEQDLFAGEDGLSSTYNFNFKHDFEKEGRALELEMDYNGYDNDEFSEYIFSGNPELQSYADTDHNQRSNYIANLDYVDPLSEHTKLELGTEVRLRNSENDYSSTNEALQDMLYSYKETIYSLYGTFGQDFDQWAYQVGLRLENFSSEGKQEKVHVLENEATRLYPSAYVTYTPSEENSYQVSYSRRIDRPSFWQLNPTRNFSTTRITSIGNPELKPELTNSFEANYTRKFEKASVRAGVFLNMIQDNNSQIIVEDPENPQRLIMTFANTGDKTTYGVEASGNVEVLNIWDLRANFNLYSYSASGIIGDTQVEGQHTSYRLSTTNSFEVTDQLKLQLFGMYMSPIQTLQFRIEEKYFINLGARYSFLEDRASVSLHFNDIFNTRIQKLSTTQPVPQVGQFKSESRNVQLGFSYRFGKGKNKGRHRETIDHNTEGGGMF